MVFDVASEMTLAPRDAELALWNGQPDHST